MKLEQDKNAKDEENATTDTTNISNMEVCQYNIKSDVTTNKHVSITLKGRGNGVMSLGKYQNHENCLSKT